MKNKSDVTVALAVIACSIVLLGALIFSVSGNPFRKPYLQFTVDFEDLTGIQKTSAVLYAGKEVGVVDRVEFLAAEDRITEDGVVRAYIAITQEIPLPANLNVFIGSESMLGEKHIALRRLNDNGGLLADGSRLNAPAAGSMLETFIPGGDAIVNNLRTITGELKLFTEGLSEGTAREDITASLTNVRKFSENLNILLAGDDNVKELHNNVVDLVEKLRETSGLVNELIEGPKGSPEEGLGQRSKVILANFEEFSRELNLTMSGTPGGVPGLRSQLEEISEEIHLIVTGNGNSDKSLRIKIDGVMANIETLTLEIQTLLIWSEYITGTIAEKPSRLVWGSLENKVPTKEEILHHLRTTNMPYPVVIGELSDDGDAEKQSSEDGNIDKKKSGFLIPRINRE